MPPRGVNIHRSLNALAMPPSEIMPSDLRESITGWRLAAWLLALLLMADRAAVLPLAAFKIAVAPFAFLEAYPCAWQHQLITVL